MSDDIRILMLEDDPDDAELETRELRSAGISCTLSVVDTGDDFRAGLQAFAPDIVISDFTLPTFDGLSALRMTRELAPDIPFIFVSGTVGEEAAVSALKYGADDYVLKNNLMRLPSAVQRAVRMAREHAARHKAETDYRHATDELTKSVERFKIVAKATNDIIWDWNVVNDSVWWSEGFEVRFGYPCGNEQPSHKFREQAIHPEDRERVLREIYRTLLTGALYWTDEYRLVCRDGSVAHVLDRGYLLRDATGRALRMIGAMMDITERKQHEEKIQRLNRVYSMLSGINSAVLRIRDPGELFTEACRIATELGNFKIAWIGLLDRQSGGIQSAVEPTGDRRWAGNSPLLFRNAAFDEIMARAIRGRQPILCNAVATDPDFEAIREEALACGCRSLAILPLVVALRSRGVMVLCADEPGNFDEDETALLSDLAADISYAMEYMEKEERLNYLAYYDALTGLPNRSLFNDRLHQQVESAQRDEAQLALLILDIDRFRNINETFGRRAGDALLRKVAQRLQRSAPGAGLARLSGDRFASIISDIKREADVARLLDQDILPALHNPLEVEDLEIRIACKSGIALFPNDATQSDSLLSAAEAALANAKRSGERYLFYTPAMNRRVAEAILIENRLRRAQDNGRFVLHYQPKFDLASGKVCGMEALVRWDDEETGLVLAGEFIPILEATGMILDVGHWVLRQVTSDWQTWEKLGLQPPPIAVNVSPIQFRQPAFLDQVKDALDCASGREIALELEITETLLMDDIQGNVPRIHALRDMGIGVAIDDFGTGYSSLSYVAKLPVDALKIDRSFVEDLARDTAGHAIVSTIISLAHALKLRVIAEGVETGSQMTLLQDMGCEEGQGFLFSRALPPDDLANLLRQPISPPGFA
jgi:diguanylate cyclase (GGDEF)-like protein/PAS domain S-box-containing protein